jgi:hypothetical protein
MSQLDVGETSASANAQVKSKRDDVIEWADKNGYVLPPFADSESALSSFAFRVHIKKTFAVPE